MAISRRNHFCYNLLKKKAEQFFVWAAGRGLGGGGWLKGTGWSSRRKGVPTMGSLGCAFQTHHFTAPTRPDLTSRP